MSTERYIISDAAKQVGTETHVLRHWEEELELRIGRNELGHRFYTRDDIALMKQIKKLRDEGFMLSTIKTCLGEKKSLEALEFEKQPIITGRASVHKSGSEERLEEFKKIMREIVSEALLGESDVLGSRVGEQVSEKVVKEINYLEREKLEREEDHYRRIDESIRQVLREKQEAVARERNEATPGKKKKPKQAKSLFGRRRGRAKAGAEQMNC
ncbi:MAG: helix-turn-helix domain-containing protein [Lachnospiraceae bacterium]|nr:helix-turn-helix domain-containing protein [Lachnospiraceae bacterium]